MGGLPQASAAYPSLLRPQLRLCSPVRGILTAPKPAKLIPKGLFAVSFWVEVLLKKFEFKQPLQRTVCELKTLDLEVSPGTLDRRAAKDCSRCSSRWWGSLSCAPGRVATGTWMRRAGRCCCWLREGREATRLEEEEMVCVGGGRSGRDGLFAGTDPLGQRARDLFPQRDRGHPQRRPLSRLFRAVGAGLENEAGLLLESSAAGFCQSGGGLSWALPSHGRRSGSG